MVIAILMQDIGPLMDLVIIRDIQIGDKPVPCSLDNVLHPLQTV